MYNFFNYFCSFSLSQVFYDVKFRSVLEIRGEEDKKGEYGCNDLTDKLHKDGVEMHASVMFIMSGLNVLSHASHGAGGARKEDHIHEYIILHYRQIKTLWEVWASKHRQV